MIGTPLALSAPANFTEPMTTASFTRSLTKHILLASALLVASGLQAQDDPRSKAIIDKLISKSKGWSTFEADFSSALVNNASKLNVKQEGNVKVKGKLFRLTLTDNTVINDGKAVYTYSKKSNEVTITDPAEMDKEMDPSKLFTIYEQGFKSQFVEEKKDASGVIDQVIKLFPLEPAKKPYHTVIMHVDKTKVEPRMVKVLYKDGNEVTYTLKKFTPNAELFESVFSFDKSKYPGAEINDMR